MKWGKKILRCFLKSPAQFLQIPTPALPKGGRVSRGSLPQLLQKRGEWDWGNTFEKGFLSNWFAVT